MQDWNPDLYRQFEAERTRPAHELLARVENATAKRVTDLGCGPGNSTELLVRRFPDATITAIDSSSAMLASARKRLPDCRFIQADISHWQADAPQDIIYANASLQWVGDHVQLLPHLMAQLSSRGVLAIQMPDNREEPSHRVMRDVAGSDSWKSKIGDAAATRVKIESADRYYDLLAAHSVSIDIWRTTYFHVMPSPSAIVEWVRSTGLRPFLDALNESEQQEFLEQYTAGIARAYPSRADGRVLLAFPRLFIVAQKGI